MTYTPGPWTVDTKYFHAPEILSNDHIVARAMYWLGSEDAAEVAANARLIAAAPQLLEACKAMEEWADKDINFFSARFVKAMYMIDAAIAAAEGAP